MVARRGNLTVAVVPTPIVLLKVSVPLCRSVIRFAIANPIPEPSVSLVLEAL